MKLKFMLNQFQKMGEFLNMVKTLAKHDERIVMITRPDSISLTVPRETKRTYLWFDINCHSFCSLYKMEGVIPEDPETDLIMFEINASYLLAALGSIRKAVNYVEVKLGKTDFPYFTINMRIQSDADQDKTVDVSNQVPVIIIPRLGWSDHDLPYSSVAFTAQAKLPRFSLVKRLIDTFKYIPTMRFVLRDEGSLTLEAESGLTRHFTIIKPIKVSEHPSYNVKYRGNPVAAAVEVKKISQFIHSLNFQTEINLCLLICQKQNVKFFFRFRDDILGHFIAPAVFEEDLEDEIEVSESDSN